MSDDIDALLDDAIETMDAQDAEIEAERAKKELESRELLDSAINNFAPPQQDIIDALGNLMGVLSKGPSFLENASDGELDNVTVMLSKALSTIEKNGGPMDDNDQGALNDCRNVLEKIKESGVKEKEGKHMTPEEIETMQQEILKLIPEARQAGAASAQVGLGAAVGGGGATTAVNASAASSSGDAPVMNDAALLQVLSEVMRPDVLREPFLALRDAFGPWLSENKDKLSQEEYKRYQNQARIANQICELIEKDGLCEVISDVAARDNAKIKTAERSKEIATVEAVAVAAESTAQETADETAKRNALMDKFYTLVAELQSYGEAPADLFKNSNLPVSSNK